jgi:hypothetical protein
MEVFLDRGSQATLPQLLGIPEWAARKCQEARFYSSGIVHNSSSERNLVRLGRRVSSFLLEVGPRL